MTKEQRKTLQELVDATTHANVIHWLWNSIAYTPGGQADFYRFKTAFHAIQEMLEEEELS